MNDTERRATPRNYTLEVIRSIDWPIVALIGLFALLVVGLVVRIASDERFKRNFTVGCAAAGGMTLYIDSGYQCVTITPVTAQVVR